jgi:energy-coupling factor transporter ATP-binding protein EcfA2
MLVNQTVSKLEALGLSAMAAGLLHQVEVPGPWAELCFEDRLGLLADAEADARDSRRLANRLKAAKLRYPAAVEDIDFRTPRGLDRGVIASLAQAGWVSRGHNVLITGATGCGKSFIACALANAAMRQGHSALYVRTPRLLEELTRGKGGRALCPTARPDGPGLFAGARRFLVEPGPDGSLSGPARSRRGSLGAAFHGGRLPAAGRPVACRHGGSDTGRGHLGPIVRGLSPHRHEGTLSAQASTRPDRRQRGPRWHLNGSGPKIRPLCWLLTAWKNEARGRDAATSAVQAPRSAATAYHLASRR